MTDNLFIQCAIKRSKVARPKLQDAGSSSGLAIKLFQYPRIGSKLRIPSSEQHLNGGTGDLKELIYKYKARTTGLADSGFISHVILLLDNDQGSRDGLWGAVKNASGATKNVDGTKRFYHVTKNLYVIPTPKLAGGKDSMIEDFLSSAVVSQVLRGKKFNPDEKTFDKKEHYGKRILAEKVSKDQASTNFDSFTANLDTIEEVLDRFSALPRVQGRVQLRCFTKFKLRPRLAVRRAAHGWQVRAGSRHLNWLGPSGCCGASEVGSEPTGDNHILRCARLQLEKCGMSEKIPAAAQRFNLPFIDVAV